MTGKYSICKNAYFWVAFWANDVNTYKLINSDSVLSICNNYIICAVSRTNFDRKESCFSLFHYMVLYDLFL